MKTSSVVKSVFLVIFITISGQQLFAQIASPHLLKSQSAINPATTALQEESSVAIIHTNGTGKTETIFTLPGFADYDTAENENLTSRRISLMGIWVNNNWGLEIFSDLSNKKVTENQNNSGSSSATGGNDYTTESKLRYVLFGLIYGPALNLGIRVAQREEIVEAFDIKNTDLTIGLGITYQVFNSLQLGVGGNLVNNQATEKVTNNRYEVYYGLSFGFKPNLKSALRLEANSITSPEDGEKASGDNAANNHRATAETVMAIEFGYEKFKGIYQTRTHVVSPLSTRPSEGEDATTTTTMGIGYTMDDPNVFFEALQHKTERIRGEYTTTTTDFLELSVGVPF